MSECKHCGTNMTREECIKASGFCARLPAVDARRTGYEVHGARFTELLRAADAAANGDDVDYFRALAQPDVIANLMRQLLTESSYSRHYEQRFHAVAAECADLASNGVGTIGDFIRLNEYVKGVAK